MQHPGLGLIITFINSDLGSWVDLDLFNDKLNIGQRGFFSVIIVLFFSSFVACDLKVGRYSCPIELMLLYQYSRSRPLFYDKVKMGHC